MNIGLQRIVLAILATGLLLGHGVVHAEPYGGTNYGACQYSGDCPSAATTPSPSSSSNSPGGSVPTGVTGEAIILNDYREFTSGDGKQIIMVVSQVVYFDAINTKTNTTERHSVTLKEVASNYVVLVVASNPIEIRLATGEKRQIDVNSDTKNDIEIKLISIDAGKATLVFRSPTATTTNAPVITTPASKNAKRDMSWYWYGACATLGIVGLIWLAIRRRARSI